MPFVQLVDGVQLGVQLAFELVRLALVVVSALARLFLVVFEGVFRTVELVELTFELDTLVLEIGLFSLEGERAVPESEQLLLSMVELISDLENLLVFAIQLLAQVEKFTRRTAALTRGQFVA